MSPLDPETVAALLAAEGGHRVCVKCNLEFVPKRWNQKYCSKACYNSDRIINDPVSVNFIRHCEWCDIKLESKNPKTRFCSSTCRSEAHKAKQMAPCFYCGGVANTTDHFLPQAFLATLEDVFGRGQSIEVPACKECNTTAGDRIFYKPKDKRLYIARCYEKKYKRLLESPDWSSRDLQELNGNLRTHVLASQLYKDNLKERLKRLRRGY